METFLVGDEVRFDGQQYVISTIDQASPKPFRLMRTGSRGVQFVHATASQLSRVKSYTEPVDDTDRA